MKTPLSEFAEWEPYLHVCLQSWWWAELSCGLGSRLNNKEPGSTIHLLVCFLTADTGRRAASCSCHHAFAARMDYTLQPKAKINPFSSSSSCLCQSSVTATRQWLIQQLIDPAWHSTERKRRGWTCLAKPGQEQTECISPGDFLLNLHMNREPRKPSKMYRLASWIPLCGLFDWMRLEQL